MFVETLLLVLLQKQHFLRNTRAAVHINSDQKELFRAQVCVASLQKEQTTPSRDLVNFIIFRVSVKTGAIFKMLPC